MSAAVLREAAALMRSRAGGAADAWGVEKWRHENVGWDNVHGTTYDVEDSLGAHVASAGCEELAEHIASWHPVVALAVADWLEATADRIDAGRDPKNGGRRNHGWRGSREALAVARAYLGSAS